MAELDEIISSGSAVAPTDENVETQTQEQQEVAQEPVETQEGDPDDRKVPVAALQKEREKAKRYTEQVADFERKLSEQGQQWQQRFDQLVASLRPEQPAPQAPDFWEAPDQAIDHRLSQAVQPLQHAVVEQREQFSRLLATEKFGEDAINEAYQALAQMKGTPEFEPTYRQIMSSPHPYGALVNWRQKQQVLSEIGSDPAAYKEKLKAELLAEMQQQNGGAQQSAPQPQAMPSNFATARNVGNRSGPAWAGPTPLADIFARK